jgi:hypothetical protein
MFRDRLGLIAGRFLDHFYPPALQGMFFFPGSV